MAEAKNTTKDKQNNGHIKTVVIFVFIEVVKKVDITNIIPIKYKNMLPKRAQFFNLIRLIPTISWIK